VSPTTEHHPTERHQHDQSSAPSSMNAGHARHASHGAHGELFRRLFWWCLLLAIPVVVSSEMVQEWFGYELTFWGAAVIAPALGTVIFIVGGRPFLIGAVGEIRERKPGMMLLIAVAITVAFAASWAATLGVGDLDFWWELAALIVVMLLGHWLEMRAVGQASGALDALAALLPDEAERIRAGEVERVAVTDLRPGDDVLVRPGGRVPADGTISDGDATLDESMITGESRPVHRGNGERVVAGTISTDSALRVRVDAVGDDTALAGIQRLVADAQASQSRAQALADRAAAALFYLAMFAAVTAMVVWSALGEPAEGIVAVVTVLVIACPHALGLAIPLVIAISTSISARAGILVTNRLALERMRNIDAVLFDKTGTLTRGNHAVIDHVAVLGHDPDHVLRLAAAAERDSEHPIARAVVAAGTASGLLPTATNFAALTGRGVQADIDGHTVRVGGPALLREFHVAEPDQLAETTNQWRGRLNAVIYVIEADRLIGAITVADQIRPESRAAIDELHARGKRVAMITGDAQQVADAIAADLGIDEVFAEVLPADKDTAVATLQSRGLRVAMVGDGVNDAPALARADVGIAIGAGTDVAIESAGVVLVSDDPRSVTGVIDLSSASYRKMVENLIWATAYNLATIPIAAGALAFAGITIPPALAAIAMSLSTIIVAANAQLLRRLDLHPVPLP
jgi:P-type Cu2+ transporter